MEVSRHIILACEPSQIALVLLKEPNEILFIPGFSEKHDEHRLKPHKMDIPRHNYLF